MEEPSAAWPRPQSALLQRKQKRGATVTAVGPGELRLLSLESAAVKAEPRLEHWRAQLESSAVDE